MDVEVFWQKEKKAIEDFEGCSEILKDHFTTPEQRVLKFWKANLCFVVITIYTLFQLFLTQKCHEMILNVMKILSNDGFQHFTVS